MQLSRYTLVIVCFLMMLVLSVCKLCNEDTLRQQKRRDPGAEELDMQHLSQQLYWYFATKS